MARAAIIVNPMAARASTRVLNKIESVFKLAGWGIDVFETTGPGDALDRARAAASDNGVDVVVAYGGDGTMNEVANGIHGSGLPIGLIPGGTGNVLAGNLRLPRNPVSAARVITKGRNRTIDLGRCRFADREYLFGVACGAGFEARLMETPSTAKRKWGVGAYVSHGIGLALNLKNSLYTVTVDGRSTELPAASLTVANCKEIIPPILVLHEAIKLDDGVLDVLAINASHVGHALLAVSQMLARVGSTGNLVTHIRGSEIVVESSEPEPAGLDGELVGHTPFTVEVLPGALDVVVSA